MSETLDYFYRDFKIENQEGALEIEIGLSRRRLYLPTFGFPTAWRGCAFQTGRKYVYRGRSEAQSHCTWRTPHAHAAEHQAIVEHDKCVLHSRERARLPRPYAHEMTRANGNGHSSRNAMRSDESARETRAGINKHPD